MNRAGCGSQTRGPDRASLRRSGPWSQCATEKSWRLSMNPLTPSLSPTGGEGGRRPGEGASRSSREQCAFKVRGVLAPSQRVRMRASLPLSLDFVLPVLLVLWLLTISTASAAEPAKAQLDFFENKIRPIFADNCYKCHSPANGKIKGGLELDWKGGWEKGGDSGPVIVPGDPEKSLLLKAVRYTDPDLQMPPKGEKLSDAQINDLVAWIKMGAPAPRATRPAATATAGYGGKGKDHWSFKPLKKPTPPSVKSEAWVKNDVDRFVLAGLEKNGMTPNDPADKRTLIRRVYYDLIGLPPTEDEVMTFLTDDSPQAFGKVVDKLLSSPHYGERWGRHWLDVARYSDSKGQFNRQRESSIYPYAWTYRDYVIKAFNDDKAYKRFIMEQLDADKLPPGNENTL